MEGTSSHEKTAPVLRESIDLPHTLFEPRPATEKCRTNAIYDSINLKLILQGNFLVFNRQSTQTRVSQHYILAGTNGMARRKKAESLVDILVVLPWWVSGSFAAGGYIACRWIMPALLPPILKPVGPSLAWMPVVLFGMVALVAWVRSLTQPNALQQMQPLASANGHRPMPPWTARSSQTAGQEQWGHNAAASGQSTATATTFHEWTLDALRAIEWKRFELLCGKYYEAAGFKTETIPFGPDGGIDIRLYRSDPNNPIALVQCKARNNAKVGVVTARELLGVITSGKVGRGILVTTSTFSNEAIAFASANPIQLIDGPAFLAKISGLPESAQKALLAFAFEGDYSTPSCASCGIKMVRREGKRGPFHGCLNFPRCRSAFPIKA
ncbi:MAG: restriction endonuclease [Herminiimonas sp.]|nr:restriction endonuclease [Herminiimonas sp.]